MSIWIDVQPDGEFLSAAPYRKAMYTFFPEASCALPTAEPAVDEAEGSELSYETFPSTSSKHGSRIVSGMERSLSRVRR